MKVQGSAWIAQEDSDEYWAEGVKGDVEVELTDQDEVRIGFQFTAEESDAVTLYVSRANADKLARFLSAVSVDELRFPA